MPAPTPKELKESQEKLQESVGEFNRRKESEEKYLRKVTVEAPAYAAVPNSNVSHKDSALKTSIDKQKTDLLIIYPVPPEGNKDVQEKIKKQFEEINKAAKAYHEKLIVDGVADRAALNDSYGELKKIVNDKLVAANAELATAQVEEKKLQEAFRVKNTELDVVNGNIKNKNLELDTAKKELEEANNSVNLPEYKYKAVLSELTNKVKESEEKVRTIKGNLDDLQKELDTKQDEFNKAQKELATSKQDVKNITDRIGNLQKNIDENTKVNEEKLKENIENLTKHFDKEHEKNSDRDAQLLAAAKSQYELISLDDLKKIPESYLDVGKDFSVKVQEEKDKEKKILMAQGVSDDDLLIKLRALQRAKDLKDKFFIVSKGVKVEASYSNGVMTVTPEIKEGFWEKNLQWDTKGKETYKQGYQEICKFLMLDPDVKFITLSRPTDFNGKPLSSKSIDKLELALDAALDAELNKKFYEFKEKNRLEIDDRLRADPKFKDLKDDKISKEERERLEGDLKKEVESKVQEKIKSDWPKELAKKDLLESRIDQGYKDDLAKERKKLIDEKDSIFSRGGKEKREKRIEQIDRLLGNPPAVTPEKAACARMQDKLGLKAALEEAKKEVAASVVASPPSKKDPASAEMNVTPEEKVLADLAGLVEKLVEKSKEPFVAVDFEKAINDLHTFTEANSEALKNHGKDVGPLVGNLLTVIETRDAVMTVEQERKLESIHDVVISASPSAPKIS